MLYVASTLGLCAADDLELIRGGGSVSKQSQFMDQLLDLVIIIDSSEDPHCMSLCTPGTLSEGTSLEEQYTRDCVYVDTLAAQENMNSLFTSRVKLLPPDIMKLVEKDWQDKGFNPADKRQPPVPDLHDLQERTQQLMKEVEKQNTILQELQNKYKYEAYDPTGTAKVNKTISLVLSELSQLITGFSYSYDHEIKQWCKHTTSTLTPLGPAVKRVAGLLNNFTQLLEGVGCIQTSYTEVCGNMRQNIHAIAERRAKHKGSRVEECMVILEESISRLEQTIDANTTIASSLNISSIKVE